MKKTGAIPGCFDPGIFYWGDMSPLQPATERGLFSGSLLISLGLHLALAAMVLFWGGFPKPGPLPILTVSLVAPEPARPGPGGPTPAPAGVQNPQAKSPGAPPAPLAKSATPPTKMHQKPKKRKATPLSRPKPVKALPPIPQRPTPSPVVQASPSPAPSSLRPASSFPSPASSSGSPPEGLGRTPGAGQAGAGSNTASSSVLGYGQGGKGSGGNPVTTQRHYLKLIRARILAQRKYPYMARQRHQEGVVRLRFTLSPAGTLSQGVQVVKASGVDLLDEQARQCVLAAAPFPPFPLDLKRDRLTVELPVIYKLSELGM